MAQPSTYRPMYLGSFQAKKGETYTSNMIKTNPKFTNATSLVLKTDAKRSNPIKVSIAGTPFIPIYLNEITAIDGVNLSYVFNQDCVIAVIQELEVTP